MPTPVCIPLHATLTKVAHFRIVQKVGGQWKKVKGGGARRNKEGQCICDQRTHFALKICAQHSDGGGEQPHQQQRTWFRSLNALVKQYQRMPIPHVYQSIATTEHPAGVALAYPIERPRGTPGRGSPGRSRSRSSLPRARASATAMPRKMSSSELPTLAEAWKQSRHELELEAQDQEHEKAESIPQAGKKRGPAAEAAVAEAAVAVAAAAAAARPTKEARPAARQPTAKKNERAWNGLRR